MTADRLIAGRYRLTDPIGTGAMGVVWRATDVRLRRTVAVKQVLLVPGLSKSAALEAKLRAMREGRIAARLHHPNAITVFDVAEEDGQPWLVMEYLDAPSLAATLAGNRTLPPVQVAEIGVQAASALAAAHDAGIVHRDVKPANLLVAADGTVKITDFGISRAVGDVTVTATGFLAGTPAYLAPEVARGENPEPASDVFALGSTLYEAVQGTPPFGAGDNPLAILHAVAKAEIEPPEAAGALGPVLMRLLAPTIDARPTMHEAKAALEAVAQGKDPHLPPPVTAVLPAPGAGSATTVLPHRSATVPAGSVDDSAATEVVSTSGSGTPRSVSAHRVPSSSGPVASGSGSASGSRRGLVLAVAAATVAGVLVLAGVLASRISGERDQSVATAGSVAISSAAIGEPPPPEQVPEQATPVPAPAQVPANPVPEAVSLPPVIDTTTAPPGPPAPSRIASFIRSYYGMLPGNVSGAWTQLSPGYQARTGYGSYTGFWGTIRAVRVDSVEQNGPNRAVVGLTYTSRNGVQTSEYRWIEVTGSSAALTIAASGI
ncbi:serine/threonine-protein kinase [Nocardia sp. 004]|uniref:serine/threonine-protein kinase n=1 Tax=Nocardia sp. 004 TaxID=3385978 RepID=UPI0039A2A4A4